MFDAHAQRTRPNIVVIVSDDMGYADIGVHGSHDIPTPNIDALARSGTRFTDAYVSGPYCSPTRAGLMTGRYPQRFGYEFNLDHPPKHLGLGLPLDQKTIADYFKAAGYRTAIFGKWHLGFGDAYHPMSRGFDEFFGFLGADHSYTETGASGVNPLMEGKKIVMESTYLTDAVADHAVDFIRRWKSQPFFVYIAFNAVHTPMQAPDKYLDRFSQIQNPQRRTYAAMLSAMDDAIGRTLAELTAQGLDENTLVIFFNDNGGPTMPGTTINGSSNFPLRGSKRQTYEGGIRVAFFIRWKGRLPNGKTSSLPIIQLDVLPTALYAAGLKMPPQASVDGVNLVPYLTGKKKGGPHDTLYWRLGQNMAVRKGDWKLVKTGETPLRNLENYVPYDLSGAELYNLATDIGEKSNLAARFPEKVKELSDAWQQWNHELSKPRWSSNGRSPLPIDDRQAQMVDVYLSAASALSSVRSRSKMK
jgi:arylsulfatase A-like enzyme